MEHVIQNFKELALTKEREHAIAIAEAGYRAINVADAIARKLRIDDGDLCVGLPAMPAHAGQAGDVRYRLAGRRVFFVGVGKCALVTAEAIEKFLGDRLTGGVALDVSAPKQDSLSKVKLLIGTHPLPSEVNQFATKRILELLSDCRADDLVIFLISGGGSTLLANPETPMTVADESTIFKELTARGATIQDLNIVRKHLSRARGGGLARAAYPAEVLSLIISDVPGDDIEFIASGSTVKDMSTIDDAKNILVRYGVTPPPHTIFYETPKEDQYFERVTNVLFLTNQDALQAMSAEALRLGYTPEVVSDRFSGEAHNVGRSVTEKLHSAAGGTALLYAGESTVTIPDDCIGNGGRNQELALSVLGDLQDDELVLPFASDGHDNTDAAGAIADSATRMHASEKSLDPETYLTEHRTFDFFSATGDALHTGYTGSNVSDLIIALKR